MKEEEWKTSIKDLPFDSIYGCKNGLDILLHELKAEKTNVENVCSVMGIPIIMREWIPDNIVLLVGNGVVVKVIHLPHHPIPLVEAK